MPVLHPPELLAIATRTLERFRRRIGPWDREDLAQETAEAMLRADARGVGNGAAYIRTAARNRGNSFLRSRRGMLELVTDHGAFDPQAEGSTVEELVGTRQNLRLGFASLSADEERAVLLHLHDHFTFEEIAALEGITLSLAENRVRTAKRKIARALEEREPRDTSARAVLLWFARSADTSDESVSLAEPPASGVRPSARARGAPWRVAAAGLLAMLCTGAVVRQHRDMPRVVAAAALAAAPASCAAPSVAAASTPVGPPQGAAKPATVPLSSAQPASRLDGMSESSPRARPDMHRDDTVLIQRARAALNARDLRLALALCDEHERRFPNSRSAPERQRIRATIERWSTDGVSGDIERAAQTRRRRDLTPPEVAAVLK